MINITITESLKKTLQNNTVLNKEYLPAYGGESAGLDLYNASGKSIKVYPSTYQSMSIKIDKKVMIPTGLKIIVPEGHVALIQERGSITKTDLKVRAGVIDVGYTGEIFINCVNIGNKVYTINKDAKLPFQLIVLKCDNQFNIVEESEYLELSNKSIRKEGQVGSSD